MSRWFRVYSDLVDDPKVQKLPPETFRALINLWCLAAQNDGVIPDLATVAFKLRVTERSATVTLATLRNAGLLDDDDGVTHPHNWNERQFKGDVSNDRVKRYRQRQRNVTSTVTATPPDTDTDTDTEAEKKKNEVARAPESGCRLEFSMEFWPAYPHQVGHRKAIAAYIEARQRASKDEILAGLRRYIMAKPPDREWLNPANFLEEDRWNDRPADVVTKPTSGETLRRSVLSVLEKRGGLDGRSAGVDGGPIINGSGAVQHQEVDQCPPIPSVLRRV